MTTTHPTDAGAAVHAVEAFHTALADQDLPTALTRLGDSVVWHEAPGMPYKGPAPYRGAKQIAEHVLSCGRLSGRADFGRAVARGRDAGGPAKRGAEVWAVDGEVGAGLRSAARRRTVADVGLPVRDLDKRGGVAGLS
jgi:hypothetical protein